jgi:hypothetical protein
VVVPLRGTGHNQPLEYRMLLICLKNNDFIGIPKTRVVDFATEIATE